MTCTRRPHSVWTTCRCDDCTRDRNRLSKLARNGAYQRAPSEAAWEVIDRLVGRGWSSLAIATATGMSHAGTQEALTTERRTGHRRTFGPRTTLQILNHGEPTDGSVGIDGTRRRLQGLARQGYDLQRLAAMSGVKFSTLAAARNSPTLHCRVWVDKAVREVTEQIGMKVGPSRQARECAEKHGWPGVLAWDDIDDPATRPKGNARRTSGGKPHKDTSGHVITCPRCGVRRQVNESRAGLVCRDCRWAIREVS